MAPLEQQQEIPQLEDSNDSLTELVRGISGKFH